MCSRAKKLCGEYAEAKAAVEKYGNEKKYYESLMAGTDSDFAKYVYQNELNKLADDTRDAARIVTLFEVGCSRLTERQRFFLKQIYVERTRWREAVDGNGYPVSTSTVSKYLREALAILEGVIDEYGDGFGAGTGKAEKL